MSQNNKSEIKQVVEDIITNLGKKGIRVTDAAVLSLDNLNPQNSQAVDRAVSDVLKKMSGMGFPGIKKPFTPQPNSMPPVQQQDQPGQQDEAREECFCRECFNFETFEQKLGTEGNRFDYATVTLGGKPFDIKYCIGPRGENIMISPKEYKVDPQWTTDTLIGELNNAVAQKQYDKAQILLNELNNRKTN